MIQDRFQGRFKLLITMPMSKGAYAIGVLLFATMLGRVPWPCCWFSDGSPMWTSP